MVMTGRWEQSVLSVVQSLPSFVPDPTKMMNRGAACKNAVDSMIKAVTAPLPRKSESSSFEVPNLKKGLEMDLNSINTTCVPKLDANYSAEHVGGIT